MFLLIHVLLSLIAPATRGGLFLKRAGTLDPIHHAAVVAPAACSG